MDPLNKLVVVTSRSHPLMQINHVSVCQQTKELSLFSASICGANKVKESYEDIKEGGPFVVCYLFFDKEWIDYLLKRKLFLHLLLQFNCYEAFTLPPPRHLTISPVQLLTPMLCVVPTQISWGALKTAHRSSPGGE